MKDSDRDWLANYLRDLADRMRLKDWAIEVQAEHAHDSTHAEVQCVDGRKLAKVRFARDWHEQTPEVLRHTCCHELVHCHFAAAWAEMSRRLKAKDFATFEMLVEYGIDGMADVIAPHLPLPLKVTHETPEPA